MADNIINKKVGDFSVGEAFTVGIMKALLEQAHAPVVGNGNFISGSVKMIEAYVVPKYLLKNDVGKNIGTALAVDGVEDMINALFKGGSSIDNSSRGNLI